MTPVVGWIGKGESSDVSPEHQGVLLKSWPTLVRSELVCSIGLASVPGDAASHAEILLASQRCELLSLGVVEWKTVTSFRQRAPNHQALNFLKDRSTRCVEVVVKRGYEGACVND